MIGIIVKDLLCSQINYQVFNDLCKNHDKYNAFLVYKNITPNFHPIKFPILNYSKIFSGYLNEDNLLVATDLDSALVLSNIKNKAKKIFYVWELEFLRDKNFIKNYNIYKSLPIYTRSESYQKILENYCNKEVKIADLNLETLWNIQINN